MVPAGTRLVPAGTRPATVSDGTQGHSSGTRQPVDRSDRSSGFIRASSRRALHQGEAARSTQRRARGVPLGERTRRNAILEIQKLGIFKIAQIHIGLTYDVPGHSPDVPERSTGCLVPLQCPSDQSDAVAGSLLGRTRRVLSRTIFFPRTYNTGPRSSWSPT